MAGDTTGATIDGAENVVVGKENRQQSGGYGDQNVTIHENDENAHATTIRLVYELVAKLAGQIDQERKDRITDMATLRNELNALQHTAVATQLQVERVGDHVAAMAAHWPQAVKVTERHRWTFAAAFTMLFAPVPLFYAQVRDHIDVSWQAALAFALVAYTVSAILWSYMWWGK
jgi:hypothetical protein